MIRRKAKPNCMQLFPKFSFSSKKLNGEIIKFLQAQQKFGVGSDYICDAIIMKYLYDFNKKKFLLDIVQEDYNLVKHILRQVGSARGKFRCQNTSQQK